MISYNDNNDNDNDNFVVSYYHVSTDDASI